MYIQKGGRGNVDIWNFMLIMLIFLLFLTERFKIPLKRQVEMVNIHLRPYTSKWSQPSPSRMRVSREVSERWRGRLPG